MIKKQSKVTQHHFVECKLSPAATFVCLTTFLFLSLGMTLLFVVPQFGRKSCWAQKKHNKAVTAAELSYQLALADFYLSSPLLIFAMSSSPPAWTLPFPLPSICTAKYLLLCVPPSFSLSASADPVLITVTTLQQLVAWVTGTIVESPLISRSSSLGREGSEGENAESQKQVRGRKMEDEREKSFTETKWFIKLQMT